MSPASEYTSGMSPASGDMNVMTPTSEDTDVMTPASDDTNGLSSALEDSNGISPAAEDTNRTSPALVGMNGISPVTADQNGVSPSEQDTTIEAWIASKDPFRVSAVGHPRRFPLKRGICSDVLRKVMEAPQIEQKIESCLNNFGIADSIINYATQWTGDGSLQDKRDCVMINTFTINPQDWTIPAKQIYDLLIGAGVHDPEVEIRNPDLMFHNISSILPDNEALLQKLENVRSKLISQADISFPRKWSSIAFHNRAPFSARSSKLVTVMIVCHPGTRANFDVILDKFKAIIRDAEISVQVEIVPGSICEALPNPKNSYAHAFALTPEPSNGSSIGVSGNNDRAGSLGFWCYYNHRANGIRKQVFVTCYHTVWDEKEYDSYTVNSNNYPGPTFVQYPAPMDLEDTILTMTRELSEAPPSMMPVYQDILNLAQRLKLNPNIGHVYAASGVRKDSNNRRLDWSVVESPGTFRKNKPPHSLQVYASDMPRFMTYAINEDFTVRAFSRLSKGDYVWKKGRASGVTTGMANRLDRSVHWGPPYDMVSNEIEVISDSKSFAEPGDSGSMVTNKNGELVGMVIGKDCQANDYDIGIVSSFDTIQADTMAMTGGYLSLE